MASTRISQPLRGVTHQLSRVSIRHNAICSRCTKSLLTPSTRAISTSTPSEATVSSIRTSGPGYVPIKPLEEQTVLATIHQFPSLEPLRLETYPANHLYLPTRRDILHRAVVYEGDSAREGTASTKTRHEVRGSRRKIRPQKGTGRARLGDKMSPMLRGGGVAFGPKPRDFSSDLPKKVYDLAWRTALSYRFRKGELIIVENAMEIESPSTRLLGDIFKHHEKLRGKGRSLMVTLEERPLLEEALAEMDRGEQTLTWEEVDVKDLLGLSRVMIERDALHNILLTHEEDLTHTTLQPWHKSLIRSSPPSALESTIGWEEFRALSLWKQPTKDEAEEDDDMPKTKNAARIAAYESAASTRFTYAESLSPGPKRTELTASVYNLIVEAKELQFLEKTGLSFSDYLENADSEKLPPRLQVLGYQQSIKEDLKAKAAETNPEQAEEIQVQIQELAVESYQVQADAALLAAQIHEHRAEALRMTGQEDQAEEELEMAGGERTNVEQSERGVLEAKVELAKQKGVVAGLKRDFAGQQKAKEEQRVAQETLNQIQAEVQAENMNLEGFEEEDLDEVGVATGAEESVRDAKEEKRI